MVPPILQKDEPVLREIAQDVPVSEITGSKFQKLISDMKEALNSQDDGVAIAAPQIGAPFRIFIISGAVIGLIEEEKKEAKLKDIDKEHHTIGEDFEKIKAKKKFKDIVFINPVISKLSKKTEMMEEGCLSVRYLYGKVKRATKATVRAYDENGKVFERGGSGIFAQIFQHETDHLDGILFIDKAFDVEDIPPVDKKTASAKPTASRGK